MVRQADGAAPPPKKGAASAAASVAGGKVNSKVLEVSGVRGEDHALEYLCSLQGGRAPHWLDEATVPYAAVQAYVVAHRTELPLPENVDLVCGGPPCQGVSGFNLFRHSGSPMDDPKNRQTVTFAEMCLLQQPRFVIMENVVGILMFAQSFVLKNCSCSSCRDPPIRDRCQRVARDQQLPRSRPLLLYPHVRVNRIAVVWRRQASVVLKNCSEDSGGSVPRLRGSARRWPRWALRRVCSSKKRGRCRRCARRRQSGSGSVQRTRRRW